MGHRSAREGYRASGRAAEPLPPGSAALGAAVRDPRDPVQPRGGGAHRPPPDQAVHLLDRRQGLGRPLAEASLVLERLASRAILLDLEHEGEPLYVLLPPMAGFFEFSMMRLRGDIDQKRLAELFYEYLNVEEEFIRELFVRGETQLGRTFVQERVVPEELSLAVPTTTGRAR